MSATSESNLATAKTILSAVGSLAAAAVVIRSVSQELLPAVFQDYIFSGVKNLITRYSNQLTLVIDEFDGLVTNELYEAARLYLGRKMSPDTRRLKISKPEKEKHFNITMERDQELVDYHNGERFKWVWICTKTETRNFYNPRDMNSTLRSETRSFHLTFHTRNKDLAINSYLPFITNQAEKHKHEKKTIKIFTVDYENMYNLNDMWSPVTLDHPATFDTLAMDVDKKEMIMKDLERFLSRREYYRNVGKAWKRGYLLYGPPGTGKSSLIAAMANYLNFDVYDLELTELRRNSELRRLLVGTANKSILVVEDIDCTIELQEKLANREASSTSGPGFHSIHTQDESKVTLSGLLNFVDGLWSSCGDERIIIFTTNHIEKLDPALLRPGRMDVHIHMSYCTPCGFKTLAYNYLRIKDHPLFREIEDSIENANVTPAEVAEQLLKNDEPDVSLRGLIDFIGVKIKQAEMEKDKADSDEKQMNVEESKENGEKEKEENGN